MKKEFIFNKKTLDMINAIAGDENKFAAALAHAVLYGLGEAEHIEEYAELEKLIDRANSCDRRITPTIEDYTYIINYLNEKCGARYQVKSRKTKDLISARFREGFTREDFCTMIDFKCREWMNSEKMRGYLRPETLFGSKFEGYLNQARIAKNNTKKTETSFDTDKFFSVAMIHSYNESL